MAIFPMQIVISCNRLGRGCLVWVALGWGALVPAWAEAGNAVVSVSHPLAAQAGLKVLQQGGDAVDAATAIQFALNVVEPQSSGIGGGFFALIYRADSGQVYALDARETAPAAATSDQFVGPDFDTVSTSGIAVGVPGTVAGLAALESRWGRLSWARNLAPAIGLARHGFSVTPYLAEALKSPRASLQPEMKAIFAHPDGSPLRLGERLTQPDLARTFERIAQQGPQVFYRGALARQIMAAQSRSRFGAPGAGRMTLADLADYQVQWRAPLVGHSHRYTLFTMPPPSAGGVALLQVLALLAPFDIGRTPGLLANEPDRVHLTVEALRMALADRERWGGDPAGTSIPLETLLDVDRLAQRGRRLDRRHRQPTVLPEGDPREGHHTTHFTVVDRMGNVVSCTSTVEEAWGSGIVVPGTGFLLNNELTDFNLTPQGDPSHPGINDVHPHHRPRSSMTPVLVFEGKHWREAYGSPGGVTIISTVVEITQALLDDGLGPDVAVAQPRFAVLDSSGQVEAEPEFPQRLIRDLSVRGHSVDVTPAPIGSVQWVGQDPVTGLRSGVADPRREGTVLIDDPSASPVYPPVFNQD